MGRPRLRRLALRRHLPLLQQEGAQGVVHRLREGARELQQHVLAVGALAAGETCQQLRQPRRPQPHGQAVAVRLERAANRAAFVVLGQEPQHARQLQLPHLAVGVQRPEVRAHRLRRDAHRRLPERAHRWWLRGARRGCRRRHRQHGLVELGVAGGLGGLHAGVQAVQQLRPRQPALGVRGTHHHGVR